MRMLKVVSMGTEAQGVELKGDKRNPEPTYFRVVLPFGDVDIARTSDGEYWVHVRVNRPTDSQFEKGETVAGLIRDARVDANDKHGGEIDASVLANPNLNHVAIRVGRDGAK